MDAETITQAQPAPADPYADRDAISALVKRKFDEWSKGRENFTYPAYRNIFFFRGRQWLRFDRTSLTGWRSVRLAPGTPTPVTNKFARVMNAHISMLARFEPSLTFAPGSHDAEDRAAADVASRVIEVISDEVNLTTHRQAGAKWAGLTGGYWRETGYDPDPVHGTVDVPLDTCPQCGVDQPPSPEFRCASCDGGPTIPALDPATGQPKTQAMPKGALYVDTCSVFEMYFDAAVTDWTKQKGYLRQKAVDLDDAKARWGTEYAATIKGDSTGAGGNLFNETLPTLGPQMDENPRTGWLGATARAVANTKVTENYYWQKPDQTYPEGLLAIFLGKTPTMLVKAGPLPYYWQNDDGSKTYFLPHVFFPQEEVPGSAWPKTVADDLAPKQAARNRWEAMIEMCGKRMANPVWLVPLGSNVRNLTGDPGQVIEYNPLGGKEPSRIPGQPITASFIENIARIDEEMNDIAATYEVLKGNRPVGISAGIALQLLKERGESQFGPMFVKWNHGEAQWAKQALAIAKLFWSEERLRQIKGKDGVWETQKFLGADLRSNIDVIPEAGISLPHSTMTERSEMEELAALAVLQPGTNPDHQLAFLKAFGKMHLVPTLEADTKHAIKENEAFEALTQDPLVAQVPPAMVAQMKAQAQQLTMTQGPVVALQFVEAAFQSVGLRLPKVRPSIDNHAIDAKEHRLFAKSDAFETLPPLVQEVVELHIAVHDYLAAQQMQALAQAQQGTATAGFLAPPGPQRSPMGAGSSPKRMEGDNREMEERLGQPVE